MSSPATLMPLVTNGHWPWMNRLHDEMLGGSPMGFRKVRWRECRWCLFSWSTSLSCQEAPVRLNPCSYCEDFSTWRIIWRWRTLVCKRSPGRRLLRRWKESGTGFPHLLLQPQGNQVHLSSKSMDLLKVRRYCIGGSQLNWDVKVKRMENNTVAADEGLFGPLQFTYIWQMFKFWRILRPYHHLRLPPQQGQEK